MSVPEEILESLHSRSAFSSVSFVDCLQIETTIFGTRNTAPVSVVMSVSPIRPVPLKELF